MASPRALGQTSSGASPFIYMDLAIPVEKQLMAHRIRREQDAAVLSVLHPPMRMGTRCGKVISEEIISEASAALNGISRYIGIFHFTNPWRSSFGRRCSIS